MLLFCTAFAGGAVVMPGSAVAHLNGDGVSCEATAVQVNSVATFVNANPPFTPCPADDDPPNLINQALPLGLGTAQVLDARVGLFNDHRTPTTHKEAVAHSQVVGLHGGSIPVVGQTIDADVLRSRTTVTCNPLDDTPDGTPDPADPSGGPRSFSEVVNLKIGANPPITQETPIDIPVGPLAAVHANYVNTTASETVRRALWVDLAPVGVDSAGDVIIAESRSGC